MTWKAASSNRMCEEVRSRRRSHLFSWNEAIDSIRVQNPPRTDYLFHIGTNGELLCAGHRPGSSGEQTTHLQRNENGQQLSGSGEALQTKGGKAGAVPKRLAQTHEVLRAQGALAQVQMTHATLV